MGTPDAFTIVYPVALAIALGILVITEATIAIRRRRQRRDLQQETARLRDRNLELRSALLGCQQEINSLNDEIEQLDDRIMVYKELIAGLMPEGYTPRRAWDGFWFADEELNKKSTSQDAACGPNTEG